MMALHADTISQDGSAGVGAGGINRNDADLFVLGTIGMGELIDESALTCSRGPGDADDPGLPGMREKALEQVVGLMILDCGRGSG
jgi:hypothetical protein